MIYHYLGFASDYIGTQNRLSGCIKDSNNWAATFRPFCQGGFLLLQGPQATRSRVLEALRGIAAQCPAGSEHSYVIAYSGHGTQNQRSNDPNEIDGLDEAICCDDFLQGGLIWDNELASILAGSQGFFATDCCHSGTMMRAVVDSPEVLPVTRAVPWEVITSGLLPCEIQKLCQPAREAEAKARAALDASGALPGVVHLAGCLDNEFSYDTAQGGAMTIAALKTFAGLFEEATFSDWGAAIERLLPTRQFPQHPFMDAIKADLARVVPGKEKPAPIPQPPIAPVVNGATGPAFIQMLNGDIYDCVKRRVV